MSCFFSGLFVCGVGRLKYSSSSSSSFFCGSDPVLKIQYTTDRHVIFMLGYEHCVVCVLCVTLSVLLCGGGEPRSCVECFGFSLLSELWAGGCDIWGTNKI